jgi:arylamine N-acetyltransferase
MQTTQLVSAALRALGFDVYDGAARVVEGPGDPRPRQPPLLDTKAEALSGIAHTDAPTQQQQLQQEEEGLTGAGAGDPDNARRAGDPAEATEGGAVPTASSLSPDASSTTGEVAEAGNAPKHHEDESPAGEAPSAEVELAMGGLSHMVCFVRLEQQLWLVDCGFGGSAPTQPVAIDGGINIIDAAQVLQILCCHASRRCTALHTQSDKSP